MCLYDGLIHVGFCGKREPNDACNTFLSHCDCVCDKAGRLEANMYVCV